MMRFAIAFSVSVAVSLAFVSVANAGGRTVGNWYVQSDKDPFSPKKKTIAVTADGASGALAIRCFPDGGLSVIVRLGGEKHFDAGSKVPFKYRADEGAIVEDSGEAFGEGAIEMPIANQIRKDAKTARQLYLRISTPDAAITDLKFETRGGSKALSQIDQDCSADEPKPSESKPDEPKAK